MKDKIVKNLNTRIADKIAKNQPGPDQLGGQVNFDSVLETKKAGISELVSAVRGNEADVQVQSADHIDITMSDNELGVKNQKSPWDRGYDILASLNEDFISLDSSIEILSDPNTKLNRKQLLAYQAGIGNVTLNIEMFTKLSQTVVRSANQVLQMQV